MLSSFSGSFCGGHRPGRKELVFQYTGGDQSFTVPGGVTQIEIHAWGAGGGGSGNSFSGGAGGYSTGYLSVNPGDNLTIIVGQGGRYQSSTGAPQDRNYSYGGGASGGGALNNYSNTFAGGGGRSAVRKNGIEAITAGGGGGAGYGGNGGAGGGSVGVSGTGGSSSGTSGGGGTQSSGGAAGSNGIEYGESGIQFAGGYAGASYPTNSEGGGGGGGYYGGGGGGDNTGGGGGSGYIGGVYNNYTATGNSKTTDGVSSGTYDPPETALILAKTGSNAIGFGAYGVANGGNGLVILVYYAAQYTGISATGLQLHLDAGNGTSYPGTGTTWSDLTGISGNTTLTNGTSYSNGAMVFDGSDDYIDFFAANVTNIATVEMWVKLDAAYSGKMFFGWGNYDVYCAGGHLGYNTGNSDVYGIPSTEVSNLNLVGNWKHYVFEMRGDVSYTNNKIYINGVQQTLSQQLSSESPSARSLNSGFGRIAGWRSDNSYRMPMQCSMFAVYNRALTTAEIQQNYNAFKRRNS